MCVSFFRQLSKRSSDGGSESDSGSVHRMKRAKSLPSPEAGDGIRRRTRSDWGAPAEREVALKKQASKNVEKQSKLIEKEMMEVGSVSAFLFFLKKNTFKFAE